MPLLSRFPRPATLGVGGLLIALLTAAAMVVASPAAGACDEVRWELRWQPDPWGGTGGSLVRVPVCHSGDGSRPTPKPEAKKRKRAGGPTRAQYRALRFRSSESVSATVRKRLIGQLANGQYAEQIRAWIESGEPTRQFDASVRAHGWSARDLGDMYTQAYLVMWLVANDKVRTSTEVDEAVRADLRRQLALDRKVGGASDRSQQQTAEWLGSWTVVIAGSLQTLRAAGDSAAVDAYRDNARRLIRSKDLLGVDLERVRLTRRGIERR